MARKAEAERDWPAETACDRLDACFAALAQRRVLGLHNAGYTMADGHAEAAEALYKAGRDRFDGYCFYHGQDVEGVLEGGALCVAFDHVDGEVPARLDIGRTVEAALRAVGLATDWDGTPARRIGLPRFDWKRRGPPCV